MTTAPEPSWTPSPDRVDRARVEEFRHWVNDRHDLDLPDYGALQQWSTADIETFWADVWTYFDVQADGDPSQVVTSHDMPGARWFPGARLNYAEHIFMDRDDDDIAIHHASETRPLDTWTWGELRQHTSRLAGAFAAAGVGEGDVVAAYLPNIPEAAAAFLACASLGAIWSSAAPEFGAQAVLDRFIQIEPKVLLCVDGYRYGGKDFDRSDIVRRLHDELPSVEQVVCLPYLNEVIGGTSGWADFESGGGDRELTFTRVPFDHPLWVLYSSGTTGLPKAIVHSQGGVLLEQLKTLNLHIDAHSGDRIFWFTTTGWMMWNFLVGCLLTPASIVMFDGNPAYPGLDTLWRLAQDARVTTFGTSASFISSSLKAGIRPREQFDLSTLTAVGSTGSPLSDDGFDWVWDAVGEDIWLFSTSGGTDVCTAFLVGVATLPVVRGELQAAALGAQVEAWDDEGKPLIDEVGELVITEPMPSMPVFFWGDDDGSKLRDAYFATYPGVWRHGDWIQISDRGTSIIRGRSDSTINRGGIRMGTAEIYRAVLSLDEIVDALVIDVPRSGDDDWMPLFVVPADGVTLDDGLQARIRAVIRSQCSPRHVPTEIVQIDAVPRTLSGKILEVPVKKILMGRPVESAVSKGALANPEALDFFTGYVNRG